MKKKTRTIRCRRGIALVTALIMGVTFMPMIGEAAFAANDTGTTNDAGAMIDTGTTTVEDVGDIVLAEYDGDELDDAVLEDLDLDVTAESDLPAMAPAEDIDANTLSACPENDSLLDVTAVNQMLGLQPAQDELTAQEETSPLKITLDTETGIATVTATTGDTISKLYVDNKQVTSATGLGTQEVSYDTKNYVVGFHTVYATTAGGKRLDYADPVPTGVYTKPTHKKNMYALYHNYFDFKTAGVTYEYDPSCMMFLSYRIKKTGDYATRYGFEAETQYQETGLTPNKTYEFILYYGKPVSYQGQTINMIPLSKKYLPTLYMKTGLAKLPIKTVTVKAVNVKRHTHIIPGYVVRNAGKETWYTYRLRVTVKMKKKPGIQALFISGKKVKGNKKTYSTKFKQKYNSIYTGRWVVKPYHRYYKHTIAKIPRGTKFTVKLYSYRDKSYKGYSPIQTRNPKIH